MAGMKKPNDHTEPTKSNAKQKQKNKGKKLFIVICIPFTVRSLCYDNQLCQFNKLSSIMRYYCAWMMLSRLDLRCLLLRMIGTNRHLFQATFQYNLLVYNVLVLIKSHMVLILITCTKRTFSVDHWLLYLYHNETYI